MTIEGKKVQLRPITSDDTPLIVKWRNNPNVRDHFVFRDYFTCQMHEKWLKEQVGTGRVIQYIIEEKDSCRPVGSVYFKDLNPEENSAEFGIFLGEDDARGKGLGRESTELFLKFAGNLGLKQIRLRVLSDNLTAIHTYEQAGFAPVSRQENVRTSDGKTINLIFMKRVLP